jgi:hypothetical protein
MWRDRERPSDGVHDLNFYLFILTDCNITEPVTLAVLIAETLASSGAWVYHLNVIKRSTSHACHQRTINRIG